MTLNEALDRLKQEFPGKYATVKVEATWSPHNIKGNFLIWCLWVDGLRYWSEPAPNLDEAIAALKRKNGIDQPEQEDVTVL